MTALQRLQAALDEETFNQVLEVLAGDRNTFFVIMNLLLAAKKG